MEFGNHELKDPAETLLYTYAAQIPDFSCHQNKVVSDSVIINHLQILMNVIYLKKSSFNASHPNSSSQDPISRIQQIGPFYFSSSLADTSVGRPTLMSLPRVDRLQGDTCSYVCPQTRLN